MKRDIFCMEQRFLFSNLCNKLVLYDICNDVLFYYFRADAITMLPILSVDTWLHYRS